MDMWLRTMLRSHQPKLVGQQGHAALYIGVVTHQQSMLAGQSGGMTHSWATDRRTLPVSNATDLHYPASQEHKYAAMAGSSL